VYVDASDRNRSCALEAPGSNLGQITGCLAICRISFSPYTQFTDNAFISTTTFQTSLKFSFRGDLPVGSHLALVGEKSSLSKLNRQRGCRMVSLFIYFNFTEKFCGV
jgi:hypothetical protein